MCSPALKIAFAALLLLALLRPADAQALQAFSMPAWGDGAGGGCAPYFAAAEQRYGLPRGLLAAVETVESAGWPWSLNVRGEPRRYDDRAQAVAALQALVGAGERHVDVGCMQISLFWHPQAFSDLRQAFEPAANVDYAARFLKQLADLSGSWEEAVARYHSADPVEGQLYRRKVNAAWKDGGGENARLFVFSGFVLHESDLSGHDAGRDLLARQRSSFKHLAAQGRQRRLARIIVLGER